MKPYPFIVALGLIWTLWHFDAFSKSGVSNVLKSTYRTDRPLILYVFHESEKSKPNLDFFLKHALHDAADFLFIFNGDSKLQETIPARANIRVVKRENKCWDLGSIAEVLIKDDLYKRYKRFITMNGSIRGPFFPSWSKSCWTDVFLDKVTDKVKLVGMTLGCRPNAHVQSMIWATDNIGMETLLFPSKELDAKFRKELPPHDTSWGLAVPRPEVAGIASCPTAKEYWKAVALEVYATPLIRSAGYEVDVMMTAYASIPEYEEACRHLPNDGQMFAVGRYWNMTMHPFDTVFWKTERGDDPAVVNKLTTWADQRNYSSYDYCKA